MRVICVKWGDLYGPEWVYRLQSGVNRHLPGHDFVCMTDTPVSGIECVETAENLPGWWSKIGLFRPGLFPGDNLYLDLDVVLTASIEPLAALLESDRSKLWSLDDFSYSLRNPQHGMGADTRRLIGGDGTINSSVMLWNDDACRPVWDEFLDETMQVLHGDQNWITQALWPNINLIPDGHAVSYKYHIQRGVKPAPVVVFHGKPKITDLSPADPLRIAWES